MPCSFCENQFTIFKRKRFCVSCHYFYCTNCIGKKKKNFCFRCETIFLSSKRELMEIKTKDLIFFLQSRKINIAGVVEKEELCNIIINYINSAEYDETFSTSNINTTNSTQRPSDDFDNYSHSFDQIRQTCQNLLSSLSDKITTDFRKTTCFNQTTQMKTEDRDEVTTQQPRPRTNYNSNEQHPGTSYNAFLNSSNEIQSNLRLLKPSNCACSDKEIDEIVTKSQNFDHNKVVDSQNVKRTKLSNSSSIVTSSFEEITSKRQQSDEDWQFVELQNTHEIPSQKSLVSVLNNNGSSLSSSSKNNSPNNHKINYDKFFNSDTSGSNFFSNKSNQLFQRRRSDSSIINIKKSSSFNIDLSSFSPNISYDEIKSIRVSCKKCGKTKSKIKSEILKLNEQLKVSNGSDIEIHDKIKEFMDYLEPKSQPLEMTNTSDNTEILLQPPTNDAHTSSLLNEEITENFFDDNEGINVYATNNEPISQEQQPSCSSNSAKRFISLDDINSNSDLETMTVKQLKEILMLNRVDFKGCCEKNELKERVRRLWKNHISAPPSESLPSSDLCKICMDAPIECVFLECGHSLGCISCCKILSECPICRSYIVRVVRIFKS